MNAHIWQMNDASWRISVTRDRTDGEINRDMEAFRHAGLEQPFATHQEAERALYAAFPMKLSDYVSESEAQRYDALGYDQVAAAIRAQLAAKAAKPAGG